MYAYTVYHIHTHSQTHTHKHTHIHIHTLSQKYKQHTHKYIHLHTLSLSHMAYKLSLSHTLTHAHLILQLNMKDVLNDLYSKVTINFTLSQQFSNRGSRHFFLVAKFQNRVSKVGQKIKYLLALNFYIKYG